MSRRTKFGNTTNDFKLLSQWSNGGLIKEEIGHHANVQINKGKPRKRKLEQLRLMDGAEDGSGNGAQAGRDEAISRTYRHAKPYGVQTEVCKGDDIAVRG